MQNRKNGEKRKPGDELRKKRTKEVVKSARQHAETQNHEKIKNAKKMESAIEK